MELIREFAVWTSSHIRPWLLQIAVAMLATLLVIYGQSINRMVKRHISSWHFVLRVLVFMLLCAFGYGALLVFCAPWLARAFASLGSVWLSPVVLLAFVVIGLLAERRNQI